MPIFSQMNNGPMVLCSMVLSGGLRSLLTKAYIQHGLGDPYFVTLLYTVGESLALPLYYILCCMKGKEEEEEEQEHQGDDEENPKPPGLERTNTGVTSIMDESSKSQRVSARRTSIGDSGRSSSSRVMMDISLTLDDLTCRRATVTLNDICSSIKHSEEFDMHTIDEDAPSATINENNKGEAAQNSLERLAHCLPAPLKPLFSAVCYLSSNLTQNLAFYYLPASIVVILTTGLELAGNAVVRHFYRQALRRRKWEGAAIVLVGTVVTAISDMEFGTRVEDTVDNSSHDDSANSHRFLLGLLFVVLKSIFRVAAGTGDEVFMKDFEYPPLLLLGMSSVYKFFLGLFLYSVAVAPALGFGLHTGILKALSSMGNTFFTLGLVLSVCTTAVFTIFSVYVTSNLTRSIWKGLQGFVVFIGGLITYYTFGGGVYGEPWLFPNSPILLLGCAILMGGVYRYSSLPPEPTPEEEEEEDLLETLNSSAAYLANM